MIKQQIPPHNLEIEQSILAGCILYPDMREEAISQNIGNGFYRTAHRDIFAAISDMVKSGLPVDLVSLADHMRTHGLLEKSGGAVYLARLTDENPIPSSIPHYCDQLKKYSTLRRIINLCQKTSQECFNATTINSDDVIDRFQSLSLELDDEIKADFITKAELTQESVDRYSALRSGKSIKAVRTGFETMDRMTGGGFRGPKLVIIAARPGVGKTSLMCNLIQNQARRGVCVGVFELEMPACDLDDRWISSGTGINSMKLSTEPGPDSDDWKRIMDAADVQSAWNVMIDDTGGLTIQELRRRARKMRKAGAEIIYIDQLSKIGGNRNMSAFERNTLHVEEIGFLKKEIGIPIVLLAQLNRDLEKRNNKKPILSDLKNTGQLEEEGDIVLLGYRHDEDQSLAEWEIAKNRQGSTFNIPMRFDAKLTKFYEITNDYQNHGSERKDW